jgi:protein disulfide isomerase
MFFSFFLLSFTLSSSADPSKCKLILELGSSNFADAISTHPHVFVLFYTKWCAHCRKFYPKFDAVGEVIGERHLSITLAKVNVDAHPGLAEQYSVEQYPSFKFFSGGKVIDYTSDRDEARMMDWLVKHSEEIVKTVNSKDELDAFKAKFPTCFVMFGKKDTEEYRKYEETVERMTGNYYAVAEDKSIFNLHIKSESALVVFKQSDDRFGIIVNFVNLEEFILKNQVPWVLPFEDQAVSEVFEKARPALFLFSKDEVGRRVLEKINMDVHGRVQLVYGDVSALQHQNFVSMLGLQQFEMPFAMILDENMQKFVYTGEISAEKVLEFYTQWTKGETGIYYKTENIAENEETVVKLNRETLQEAIGKNDMLVMFYTPNCGYSRILQLIFQT